MGVDATEYSDRGIYLVQANNDRAAGYGRLLELLHVEPGRIRPPWAQVREGVDGAPRLYVFETCKELIRQLKSAPIATEGMDAVEAVDKKWEGEHGHAVAAARYGAMTRPAPAGPPDPGEPDDWRTYVLTGAAPQAGSGARARRRWRRPPGVRLGLIPIADIHCSG